MIFMKKWSLFELPTRFEALGQTVGDLHVWNYLKNICIFYILTCLAWAWSSKSYSLPCFWENPWISGKMRSFRAFYAFLGIRTGRGWSIWWKFLEKYSCLRYFNSLYMNMKLKKLQDALVLKKTHGYCEKN